jgi:acetamidase/formamidase
MMQGVFGDTIHIDPDRTHVGHSTDLQPVGRIRDGDVLELELPDSSGGQLDASSTAADVAALDRSRANPVIGPIWVDGASPGDTIAVEILAATPRTWAFTVQIPGMGILGDEVTEHWIHSWRHEDGKGVFVHGIRIPLEPFPGVLATAPAVPGTHWVSHVPQRVGGNLDLKHAFLGSTVYLPVEVEGALLSIGDPHWAQGDGEVCGSAIEGSIDLAARVTVRKDLAIEYPELDVTRPLERPSAAAAGYHVTTGIDPDLRDAARIAIARMTAYLVAHRGLDRQQAYALCSVAADLKISEVVDAPNWVVSAFMPNDVFGTGS